MLYDYIISNYEKDEPIFYLSFREIQRTIFVRK